MDRASWLRILERWFNRAQIENLPGYRMPEDVPTFAGAVNTQEDGSKKLRTIRVAVRDLEARYGNYVHGYVTGIYLIADTEVCVLVGENSCSFIPWETIVFIAC